jgi:uncharacterized protein YciI
VLLGGNRPQYAGRMPNLRSSVLPIALLLLSLVGCQSTAPAPKEPEWTFALLVTGPNPPASDAERQKIMAGHMANIGKLVEEKKLVVAGPFGNEKHDPKLRGVFVFDTSDVAAARAWGETDPAISSGAMALEIAPFATEANLRRAVELHQAREAEAKSAGTKLEMKDTIRAYVLVFAHDAEAAREGLADARAERKVVFEGRLDGSERAQWLAVLDAADVAEGEKLLGDARAKLGKHELASWWASKDLARLDE